MNKLFRELNEDEVKDLLYAHHTGLEIETRSNTRVPWQTVLTPQWCLGSYYRVKPALTGYLYLFDDKGWMIHQRYITSNINEITYSPKENTIVASYVITGMDKLRGEDINGGQPVALIAGESLTLEFSAMKEYLL